MNKKVSELMDEIDYVLLKDIDIEKMGESIKDNKHEREKGNSTSERNEQSQDAPSLDRIKVLSMGGIKEMGTQTKKCSKVIKFKRHILPLVAAIMLLGSTAIAIGSSNHIRELFGESFGLIQTDVQTVQMTDRSDGIIFTAEEVILDKRSALIIVSCEREDGSAFEENVDFFELRPRIEGRGGSGWSRQVYFSEDRTRLFTVIDYSSEKKLDNKYMTLQGRYLGKREVYEGSISLDIAELYEQSKQWEVEEWQDYVDSYDSSKVLGVEVLEDAPIIIDRVQYRDGILEIITSYPCEPVFDTIEVNFYLKDRNTGEIIKADGGGTSGGPYGGINKGIDEFEDFPIERLVDMELGVEIHYFDRVSDGQWEVSFKLDENKNILSNRPYVNITKGALEVKIKEVEVSALGVKIKGTKNRELMQDLAIQLVMKDGEKLELVPSASSGRYNYLFTQDYIVGDQPVGIKETGESIEDVGPQSKTDVKEGMTESSGIGESSFSVSTQQQFADAKNITLPALIDIDQVEGVIIEGTAIEIKR